ncbi:hypothetical protein Pse7367_2821 [Thalassoporum mexicanum PCC 7367]|uniref:hypothetical protein n=1 Tax=Thalassoporum mexicanum TaxID=3457544 RepID=UPI00029FF89B|nr:hypothetical protein [Pseudanabaena sp. PCC 7367]AFY71074.1 hypothetical protein Pse7367_2821 [Pseudanabaena sp. PCC 7367]
MQSNPVIHPPAAAPASSATAGMPDGTYKPSVPMWVYRQLSQELNLTQAQLANVEREKERLYKQNQILVKELSAIAKSNQQIQETLNKSAKSLRSTMAQTLAAKNDQSIAEAQELAESLRLGVEAKSDSSSNGHYSQPSDPVDQQVQEAMAKAQAMISEPAQPEAAAANYLDLEPEVEDLPDLKAEIPQPEVIARRSQRRSEFKLNGLAMAAIVVAVVATSFGAGYLIVKPLTSR